MTVVVSGIALACSPVSAAMAAMITLTDVEPYNFSLVEVLSVTIPASLIGIFVASLVAVGLIIVFGLFPDLRPTMAAEGGGTEPIGVTPIIEMLMFTAAGIMILV